MDSDPDGDDAGIGRRDLFTSALAVGVLATAAHAAEAETASATAPTQSVDLGPLPRLGGRDDLRSSLQLADALMSENITAPAFVPTTRIAQPIDMGADTLLAPFQNARLAYSPLEVEYLLQTLNDHIRNCLDLRKQGQELEAAAVNSALAMLYENEVLRTARVEAEVLRNNRSRILSETIEAGYDPDTNRITGSAYNDQYFAQRAAVQEAYLAAKKNELERRKEYFAQDGGGSNLGQRFDFVKELFEIELKEAYQRAQAVSAGLFHIYGIRKPAPPLRRSGYLNLLTQWTREAVYELERKMLSRTESVVTLALGGMANARFPSPLSAADFASARQTGLFRFSIPEAFFNSRPYFLLNPRLRGVEVAFWGSNRAEPTSWGPNAVEIKLAEQRVNDPSGNVVFQVTPRAVLSPTDFMTRRAYDATRTESLHNASPVGQWDVDVGAYNLTGTDIRGDGQLTNLIMMLTIAHDR